MRLPRVSVLLLLAVPFQLAAAPPASKTKGTPAKTTTSVKAATPSRTAAPAKPAPAAKAPASAAPAADAPPPLTVSDLAGLHEELAGLRTEVQALREALTPPPPPPDPDEAARAEKRAEIQATIDDAHAQMKLLDSAVAGGVAESVVAPGRADLQARVEAAEAELAAVDEAPPPEDAPADGTDAPADGSTAPPPEPPPAAPTVKMSGTLYAHYALHLAEGTPNDFDLDRAYLTAQGTLTPILSTRLTVDADRLKEQTTTLADGSTVVLPQDTKTRVYLKNVWLEVDTTHEVKVRVGMIDTPWAPFSDQFWGQRYISRSMSDEVKLVSTADLGVGAIGKHADGLVGWHAVIINGEGYSSLEVDAGKTAQARITVDPLAPGDNGTLPLSAFVSYALPGTPDGDGTLVYAASAGVEYGPVTAMAEYIGKQSADVTGSGFSITLVPHVPKVLNVVARFDLWDADTNVDDDTYTKLIAGVSHDFTPKVSLAAMFERLSLGTAEPSNAIYLRGQAGF